MITDLNFDKLVSDYNSRLDSPDGLRGFGQDQNFLEMWVPDPDTTESVCNLIESATDYKVSEFTITFSEESFENIDLQRLASIVGERAEIVSGENCTIVVKTKNARTFNIHQIYQAGIAARAVAPERFKRVLESSPDYTNLSISIEQIELSIAFDPRNHIIADVGWIGTLDATGKVLVELLCQEAIGVSIEEFIEHTPQRVEYFLRDHSAPRHIAGIITVRNADPAFGLLLKITEAFSEKIKNTEFKLHPSSSYRYKPNGTWVALTAEEQVKRSQSVLDTVLKNNLSNFSSKLGVIEVQKNHRVMIVLPKEMKSSDKQKLIVQIEKEMKSQLDPSLYVLAEERKDANQIRNIKESERS